MNKNHPHKLHPYSGQFAQPPKLEKAIIAKIVVQYLNLKGGITRLLPNWHLFLS